MSIGGLQPGQMVTVHASRLWSLYPIGQELYRGQATYQADGAGNVDLESSAPLPGSSYRTRRSGRPVLVDGAGAAPPGQWARDGPSLVAQAELRPDQVRLEAEVEGRIVARADVRLRAGTEDVTLREIREPGVVGLFARGPGSGRQPAIIVLGGSEGGLDTARWAAPLLASHGYSVLGLAYFQGGEPALTALAPISSISRSRNSRRRGAGLPDSPAWTPPGSP